MTHRALTSIEAEEVLKIFQRHNIYLIGESFASKVMKQHKLMHSLDDCDRPVHGHSCLARLFRVLCGARMYRRWQSLDHLPRALMCSGGIPAWAAAVAAPIHRLCVPKCCAGRSNWLMVLRSRAWSRGLVSNDPSLW